MEYERKGMRFAFEKGKENKIFTDTKEKTNRKKIHVNQKIIHLWLYEPLL